MKLDLGAGEKRDDGYVTLDIAGNPDVLADARDIPFPDDTFEEVRCWHVLEHIDRRDLITVMNECHRVLQPGGLMDIEAPVFPFVSAIADPTHVSFMVPQTFDYFTRPDKFGPQMRQYGIKPWKLVRRQRINEGQIMRVALEKPGEE